MAPVERWALIWVAVIALDAATAYRAYVLYPSPASYGQSRPVQYPFNPFYRYVDFGLPSMPLPLDLRRPPQRENQTASLEKESPFDEAPTLVKSNTPVVGIIGGAAVPSGELPGHVIFVDVSTPLCGGTLITSTHVLTSAYCADFLLSDQTNIRAYVNTAQLAPLDSRTEVRSISSIVKHPDYGIGPSLKVLQSDMAIVQLDYPVRGVRRVRLSNFYDNYVGDTMEAYGFGYPGPGLTSPVPGLATSAAVFVDAKAARQSSNYLRKATGTVLANSDCATLFGAAELNDAQYLCITTTNPICIGDQGSPLMKNGVQYGIASVNYWACSLGYPSVYMRVKSFKDWIISVIDA